MTSTRICGGRGILGCLRSGLLDGIDASALLLNVAFSASGWTFWEGWVRFQVGVTLLELGRFSEAVGSYSNSGGVGFLY